MGITLLLFLVYILIFILIILIISLLLRLRNIEKKLVNFTPTEAYTIMETMRDMVIESERVADKLDGAIKDREAVLEDFSDLVDEKLARLDVVLGKKDEENNKKDMIADFHRQGLDNSEIARRLGVSLSEVSITLSLLNGRK